jgi:hypothetical protein
MRAGQPKNKKRANDFEPESIALLIRASGFMRINQLLF